MSTIENVLDYRLRYYYAIAKKAIKSIKNLIVREDFDNLKIDSNIINLSLRELYNIYLLRDNKRLICRRLYIYFLDLCKYTNL